MTVCAKIKQMEKTDKVQRILTVLEQRYGEPPCALRFGNVFELLVAVMLSAQCTDARVNVVTESLFQLADTPQKMLALGQERLERLIFSCGFYHNKARNILKCCAELLEKYDGQVPAERDVLKTLSGVGDKTASVVYAVGFGGQAIPVDTHVGRLARRLGLSLQQDPSRIMRELEALVPTQKQSLFHHLLITHGRQICKSARPLCDQCPLNDICDYVGRE